MGAETEHREIILAGSGGQGVILAAILLAEAAILEGKRVVQTQSYGIATRGGLSCAEVIIDRQEILFQQVQYPDLILTLTDEALRKYAPWANRGVSILYDTTLTGLRPAPPCSGYPFTRVAHQMGNEMSVNILALGSISELTGFVQIESLKQAIRKRWPKASEDNERMIDAGCTLVSSPGKAESALRTACTG